MYTFITVPRNKTYLCTMCNCVCIIQTSTDDKHCGENVYAVSGQKSSAEAGIRLSFSPLLLTTGRQLPPLSSVLYGIISERRSVLAAQLLLREKSGGLRVATDSNIRNIPSLPGGSIIFMIFIWWKLKISYHTVYPSWDGPSVVCYLFLYLFI